VSQQQWGYGPTRGTGAAWPQAPATGWPGPQAGWPQQGWPTQAPQAPRGYGAPTAWPAPQPPRRRRSGLGSVLKIVLAIAAILFVASIVKGMLAPDDPSRPPVSDPASPVQPYTNEGYTAPPPDLDPPGVPGPRSLEAARTLTTENPLYDETVPVPTNCAMGTIDMRTASPREMEGHFNELMGCLMAVFDDAVTDAGFELPRPPVTVYDSPIKTACGDFDEVNAAYCTGDQRIYYAAPLLDAFPPAVGQADYAAEMILAHEFGHAVQARTAILISGKVLEERASTEEAALDLSRRTEVQADCLSGQFVRSVAQSRQLGAAELENLSTFAFNLGDDVLTGRAGYSGGHGTGQARQAWFERGLGSDAIGVCNTFVATSAQVR